MHGPKTWLNRLSIENDVDQILQIQAALDSNREVLDKIDAVALLNWSWKLKGVAQILNQLKPVHTFIIAPPDGEWCDWPSIPVEVQTAICKLFHRVREARFVRMNGIPLELLYHANNLNVLHLDSVSRWTSYLQPMGIPACLTQRARPAGAFISLKELHANHRHLSDFSHFVSSTILIPPSHLVPTYPPPVWDLSRLCHWTFSVEQAISPQNHMPAMNKFIALCASSLISLRYIIPLEFTVASRVPRESEMPNLVLFTEQLQKITIDAFVGWETVFRFQTEEELSRPPSLNLHYPLPWIEKLLKLFHPMKRSMEKLTLVLHVNAMEKPPEMEWAKLCEVIMNGHPTAKPLFRMVIVEIFAEHARDSVGTAHRRSGRQDYNERAEETYRMWNPVVARGLESLARTPTEKEKGILCQINKHEGHWRYCENYGLIDGAESDASWE